MPAAVKIKRSVCALAISLPLLTSTGSVQAGCSDANDHHRHNGVGGVSIQAVWLNTDPLRALARTDRYLRGKQFDFDNRLTPLAGLTSYHESAAGVRTGGGMWVGYKLFQSRPFTTVDSTGRSRDSLAALRIIPAYGGFSVEKALRLGWSEIHGGALIGGGAYLAHRSTVDVDDPSLFRDADTAAGGGGGTWGGAGFGTVELSAGAGVDVAPLLRISLDGVLSLVYSPEGFGVGYGDFYSISPSIRLRLLFGRV